MARKAKSWLEFKEGSDRGPKAKPGRTRLWFVNSTHDGSEVGSVGWHPPWRKYCFFSTGWIVLDPACMREIAEFVEKATKDHKENRP